ncbi:hypothetical protein Fcan01_25396 [Folsomia candida]|uniref:Uncharacterized protein n=1 Tax=Folsomia candida TaxID=158441 RepID=A0A226D442_FOLCA|nr:hypothetical protein Fcan01_25396 [Folsomia candida]
MSSCHPLPYAATPTYANHTFFNNQRQRILFLLHRSNPPPHPTSPPHPSSPQTNFSCIRHNSETPTLQQSSPTKALSTPAADTINLCLPSPPQPKILVRHMGHQLSPPRQPLPQIYPRILRHVPEFYLIPPLVVTPHVPSDIDHAIDSYTLPAWRNNVPILQRPRPLQFTTDISFLYTVDLLTSNPVEHPGVTPNFQKLDNQPHFHLDAEYTPSCDNALSHSGDLLDMIEGVSSTCPVSKNDAHRDTAGNEDPASTKSS